MQLTIKTTKKQELIDITDKIQDTLNKQKIENGLINIYIQHTTASLIINENNDPNICTDLLNSLSSLVPSGKWLHDKIDNNASAHIKSSILNSSLTIPFENKKLLLGRWQSIMLAEFDGPRNRNIIITIIKH